MYEVPMLNWTESAGIFVFNRNDWLVDVEVDCTVGEMVGEMRSKIVSQFSFYPPQGSPCKQLTSALSHGVLSSRDRWKDWGGSALQGVITFIVFKSQVNPGIMRDEASVSEESVNAGQILRVVRVQSAVEGRAGCCSTLCLSLLSFLSFLFSKVRGDTAALAAATAPAASVFTVAERFCWYWLAWHQTAARYQPNNGPFHPEYNFSLGQARPGPGFTKLLN